jgi:inner membrane protein
MPYPPVHLTLFVLLLVPIALYGFAQAVRQGKVQRKDWGHLLLLLAIGGFFSLFPDISAVWNLLVYGKLGGHCMIGSFPTHSILFSIIAIVSGFLIGMLVYKQQNKALALGLFALATTLFHLLLDDLDDGVITYLYPVYNEPFSLFTFLYTNPTNMGFLNYAVAVAAGVFSFAIVLVMNYASLKYLGFGPRYVPFKQQN